MEIVSTPQHRTLTFVHACNRSGYRPTLEEVKLWFDEPAANVTTEITAPGLLAMLEGMQKAFSQVQLSREVAREHPVDHLVRIKWLEASDDRLRLTRLGEALLTDIQRGEEAEDSPVVVLETTDRFAYARLIGEIARLGDAFLVDPYFRLPQLATILDSTRLKRVLISKQYKGSKEARDELAVALAAVDPERNIQIRATAATTLHDRLVVADSGDVYMLGASLGTIGKANTAFMKVPEKGAAALKQLAEDLWDAAEPVLLASAVKEESGQ
ncbi:hypothetical protein ACLQ29_08635 [Micromonospora sp. DT228]|uniref:hypothetical protein n=1 Tax=Micromonospora sp. DT228 TaxID=3393443 RepID=UPI003CE93750